MVMHSRVKALNRHRRLVFRLWVGLTVVLGGFLGVSTLFLGNRPTQYEWVAVAVPPTMIALALLGVGWLVWLVTARRQKKPSE